MMSDDATFRDLYRRWQLLEAMARELEATPELRPSSQAEAQKQMKRLREAAQALVEQMQQISPGYWIYAHITERLIDCRVRSGLTQAEVAQRIGMARSSYVNMESGRQRISIEMLYRLASVFGVDVLNLLPPSRR
jgi:DNA-binding XRE family transcriptional regulator